MDRLALSRRRLLISGAAGAALMVVGLPARPARAGAKETQELIDKLTHGKAKPGRVTLRMPEIAENGNTVPLTVEVDSPMSATDRVKSISLLAEGNPSPLVATLHFGPLAAKAEVQLRIRLAQTQNVIAVAEMADGSFWTASHETKVTIGGCGG
jgi:sulfur-oxidizing protein SoxY